MLTSIIFPTTGRKERAISCLKQLLPTIEGREVEIVAVVDADPDSATAIRELMQPSPPAPLPLGEGRFRISESDTLRGIGGAFNAGLAMAHGDYIVVAADDLEFGDGWLEEAIDEMNNFFDWQGVVAFNDGHWDGNELGTHYVISRDFIVEHLGGRIGWPCYKHSFHDLEINERAKKLGCYRWAKDAHVTHRHWTFGDREQDDSDRRWLSHYEESRNAYELRKLANFPDNYPPVIGPKRFHKHRIGWLADIVQYEGGAEMVARELASIAPDDMVIVPCPAGQEISTDVEAYVLNNCTHYKPDVIPALRGKKVFKIIHDEWPHGDADFRKYILEWADLLFFSSPLHRELFKYEVRASCVIAPPNVNWRPFQAVADRENRKGACWVGRMWPGKGIENALRWAASHNSQIDFYGYGPDCGLIEPPGRYRGQIDYEELPDVLAKYEKFVFLPDTIEPFSRTTVEAWFAGCELVVNKNVGALHWIQNEPGALTANGFWDTIREKLEPQKVEIEEVVIS